MVCHYTAPYKCIDKEHLAATYEYKGLKSNIIKHCQSLLHLSYLFWSCQDSTILELKHLGLWNWQGFLKISSSCLFSLRWTIFRVSVLSLAIRENIWHILYIKKTRRDITVVSVKCSKYDPTSAVHFWSTFMPFFI